MAGAGGIGGAGGSATGGAPVSGAGGMSGSGGAGGVAGIGGAFGTGGGPVGGVGGLAGAVGSGGAAGTSGASGTAGGASGAAGGLAGAGGSSGGATGPGGTGVGGMAGAAGGSAGGAAGSAPVTCGGPLGWGSAVFAVQSPDGSVVAIASRSSHLEVRRWADGGLISNLSNSLNGVSAVAFSADGSLLASSDATGVKIWRVADGSLQNQIQLAGLAGVSKLALSQAGDVVAGGSVNGSLQVWRASNAGATAQLVFNSLLGGTTVSPDGTQVVAYNPTSGKVAHVTAWSSASGSIVWDQSWGTIQGTVVGRVAYSLDGTMVAAPTNGQGVVVLNAATGAVISFIGSAVDPWAFSSDGTAVAGTTRVATSSSPVPAILRITNPTGAVARSYTVPDGGTLLSVGFGPSLAIRTVDKASAAFGFAENGSSAQAVPAFLDSERPPGRHFSGRASCRDGGQYPVRRLERR